ncbi:hypothetical protein BCY86_05130 [Pajaroellobacter abortibovis]|uniref:Uncharacterized protein n=1 Tax=Pajaroellobacter abortibovis TaxID=1882918 RepID=A0A1L6MXE2_9BACT|nr:hypothetical protein BCY86_05130 [Pajaroellobacter abortibovis]
MTIGQKTTVKISILSLFLIGIVGLGIQRGEPIDVPICLLYQREWNYPSLREKHIGLSLFEALLMK